MVSKYICKYCKDDMIKAFSGTLIGEFCKLLMYLDWTGVCDTCKIMIEDTKRYKKEREEYNFRRKQLKKAGLI